MKTCHEYATVLLLLMKKTAFPELSKRQLEKLSDISADIGLVALASVVLPAVLDRFNLTLATVGTTITVGSWIYSVWLRR